MNKPGEIVKHSGIYGTTGGREAALSKGDRFPPTVAGGHWQPKYLTHQPSPKSRRANATRRARHE